jgi:hypothetical protein
VLLLGVGHGSLELTQGMVLANGVFGGESIDIGVLCRETSVRSFTCENVAGVDAVERGVLNPFFSSCSISSSVKWKG